MMKQMTDLGLGKRDVMEEAIWNDANVLLANIMQQDGRPIAGRGLFLPATSNVIWALATGELRSQNDPVAKDLTQKIVKNFENMSPSNPWALICMNSVKFTKMLMMLGLPNIITSSRAIADMIRRKVESSSPDPSGNYIERGLAEIEKDASPTLNKSIGKEHLMVQLGDMFVAGTDTTSSACEWCLAYLLIHRSWQDQIYAELEELTGGNERKVSLEDREKAHKTNAFIEEVLRHSPLGLFPPPHKTLADTVLDGKHIPKGTQVMYSLYSMHREPKYYDSPNDADAFRPERFIFGETASEEASRGVFKRDLYPTAIFGAGKRRCPGEQLARMEMFTYIAGMVQRFSLDVGPDGPPNLTDAITGLVMYCRPFTFVARKRQTVNLT